MYKVPFSAITKALYYTLSNGPIGLEWFDASVPFDEIEEHFKQQDVFAYGIFGQSTADCTAPDDLKVWTSNITIEIYSNYRGRKMVAEKLEALMNYLSGEGWNVLCEQFAQNGFTLGSVAVGSLNINLPIYSEIGVWQSGTTDLIFKITQIEQGE